MRPIVVTIIAQRDSVLWVHSQKLAVRLRNDFMYGSCWFSTTQTPVFKQEQDYVGINILGMKTLDGLPVYVFKRLLKFVHIFGIRSV